MGSDIPVDTFSKKWQNTQNPNNHLPPRLRPSQFVSQADRQLLQNRERDIITIIISLEIIRNHHSPIPILFCWFIRIGFTSEEKAQGMK